MLPVIELGLLLASVIFGILCFYFRISYRVSVGSGIVALVGAGVSLALGREDVGNMIGLLAYYLLVVGVVLALLEYRTESRQALREESSD